MASKREIARRYAQQRREAKARYKQNNDGSARGFRSSDEYNRIARNQRQTERRYDKRIVRDERRREVRDNAGEVGQENLKVVQEWDTYHNVLGYGGAPRSEIRDQFQILRDNNDGKDVYLRIQTPTGAVGIYRTLIEADQALQALYQKGKSVQDKSNDSFGMMVAAVYGDTDKERFINVYTKDVSGIKGAFDFPDLPESSI